MQNLDISYIKYKLLSYHAYDILNVHLNSGTWIQMHLIIEFSESLIRILI